MKAFITEIRKAEYSERENTLGMANICRITYKYEVHAESGIRAFITQSSAEQYVKYLQEQKNDYTKVIKEIDI